MTTAHIQLLQAMPIFGALRDDTLEFLVGLARSVRVHAGDYFFREGEPATGLFVIETGAATVLKGWEGQEIVLRQLRAGDCFGEMALLDLMPRSASVRADEDCLALQIDSEDLYRLCGHDAEQFAVMLMNLGREISRRLRDADETLFRVHCTRVVEGAFDASAVGGVPRAV